MKKKYFTPEMEELEIEAPVILAGSGDEAELDDEKTTDDPISDF